MLPDVNVCVPSMPSWLGWPMKPRCPEESGYCGKASWRGGGAIADDGGQLRSAFAVDVAVASGELDEPMAMGIPQPPVSADQRYAIAAPQEL